MKSEVDGLLQELRRFQEARGRIEHNHPKVRVWVSLVRTYLDRQSDPILRQGFDRLNFTHVGSSMWHRGEPSPPELQAFMAELDQAAALLRKTFPAGEADGVLSIEAEAPSPPLEPPSEEPQIEEEAPVEPKRQDTPKDPSRGTPSEVSLTPRMERLLADLKQEVTRANGDLETIQNIMGELLDLKKMGNLIDRLRTECARPEAPWDSIRETMAKLWSVRKDLLLELMPRLLGLS